MVHIIISLQNLVCVPSGIADILQNEMLNLKYLQIFIIMPLFSIKTIYFITFVHT